MNASRLLIVASTIVFLSLTAARAQPALQVSEPWVRATVPQQKATGMFARITAMQGGRLVGATSPVADVVEIHEMSMDGNVMRMRAVPGLDLPAGQQIELKPGGFHVMLMGLKQQLREGEDVPLTLVVEGKDGKRQSVEIRAQARGLSQGQGHGRH